MSDALGVAVLGYGVVGSAVVRLLHQRSEELAARVGRPLELRGIAVRRAERPRELPEGVDQTLFTADATALVARTDVDIVVEVIGGIEPARTLQLAALTSGKSVVSANKALLADHGNLLHAVAANHGVDLYYEAAVAGAIPLLRPLQESLAGDRVQRVLGIVNGTTNFILSRMDATGVGFDEALAEATALGYAEADPSADVEGFDAAAKAAILARLAFHLPVTTQDVYREGIADLTAADIAGARALGCTVKLLAICDRDDDGALAVRVHPAMISRSHPLAGVSDAYNAVFIEAEAAGGLMFYGRGAGGDPTASAVLGDVVAVGRHRLNGVMRNLPDLGAVTELQPRLRPFGEVTTRYHVSLEVADRPGVLATVSAAFAERDVSISTVRQEGRGDDATLVLVTHIAPEASLAAVVDAAAELPMVRRVAGVLRVEGNTGGHL